MIMDVINTSKVALTRNDLCGNRPRRAGTTGTRSAMLLLAAVAALTGARAVRADEAVVAWGNNQYGQCITPPGIGVVDAIAAGVGFTVALKVDGAVIAWGNNQFGQCTTPLGIGFVVAIAAGGGHTVALKADGSVVAWGLNNQGQCTTPPGIGIVAAISAGELHTVALKPPSCDYQLAAAQAVIAELTAANAKQAAANAQQAAEILFLNARIVILQLGDLNEDGVIDSGDLATLLNSWGTGGK